MFLRTSVSFVLLVTLGIQVALPTFVSHMPLQTTIPVCPANLPNCNFYRGKVLLHRTLLPPELLGVAVSSTASLTLAQDELRLSSSSISRSRDALIKFPLIKKDAFPSDAPLTVKITVATNPDLATVDDSDLTFGVTDGVRFVGYFVPDATNYRAPPATGLAPCFGAQGTVQGDVLATIQKLDDQNPVLVGEPYPGRVEYTIKLNDNRGYCSTAQQGGFVKSISYSSSVSLNRGLDLVVFSDDDLNEQYGIRFLEVKITVDDETQLVALKY